MNKVLLLSSAFVATSVASFGAMTANPSTGLTAIEGYADSALTIAIGIGVVVVGWGYIKRLVKKG